MALEYVSKQEFDKEVAAFQARCRATERHIGVQTPWGKAQGATKHGDGITFYSTPSHGGFHVSDPALLARIPAVHRAYAAKWSHGFGEAWFEEDCAANAVIVAFPDRFEPGEVERARRGLAWIERT